MGGAAADGAGSAAEEGVGCVGLEGGDGVGVVEGVVRHVEGCELVRSKGCGKGAGEVSRGEEMPITSPAPLHVTPAQWPVLPVANTRVTVEPQALALRSQPSPMVEE